jgi:CO/xanthine dehydrogenase FAD-binding subunit
MILPVDIAFVGVGASVTFNGDAITDCRIALGAVGYSVIRAYDAEHLLRGHRLDETTLNKVAEAATAIANPISDQRASAGYRKKMVGVLTRQALLKAADIAHR